MVYFGGGAVVQSGGNILSVAENEIFTRHMASVRNRRDGVLLFCRTVRMYY